MLAIGAVRFLGVWGALAIVVEGCTHHATPTNCDEVLNHYVEMLVREHNPDLTTEKLREQTAVSLARARQLPSFRQCPSQLDVEAIHCAMTAGDVNELERCLE